MPATLDMNTHTHHREPEPVDKPGKLRFTYASGSRPLDGYTIKRGVGRGGFGEVYYAVSDAGKDVALKLIRRNLEVELRGVTHCLNLKHPNLIDIYDIRTDANDDRWVVMEYVAGAALDDVIERYPEGMPTDMAVEWFRGICDAVAYLHDHGIVHRDLKPGNIFIDDGRVKIGDYGLSKFISCSRRSGQTESVGTVHYMAPEIANGRYGREIDTYAVGIILFEMLTGHVPFEGESVGEVLMKHLTAEPDLTKLAEPFLGIVAGAMAKDPERRTQNVTDMLRSLSAYDGQRGDASAVTTASTVALGAMGGPAAAAAANAGAEAIHGPRAPYTAARPAESPVGPSPAAPTSPGDPPPEPVAQFVKEAWRESLERSRFRDWPWWARVALIIGAVWFIGLFNAETDGGVFAAGIVIGFAYILYRRIRAHVLAVDASRSSGVYGVPTQRGRARPAGNEEPTAYRPNAYVPMPATPTSTPAASAQQQPSHYGIRRPWRRRQQTWQTAVQQFLREVSWHDRLSGMFGSLLIATVVGSIAAAFGAMFIAPNPSFEHYLWLAIVTVAGSWAVMIPTKLSEGHVEDQAPLRFTLLLAGGIVGAIAWLTAEMLLLGLPTTTDFAPGPWDSLWGEFFRTSSQELGNQVRNGGRVNLPISMHAAYFGFLLLVLRWWRMAEWSRSARVSLWSMFVATGVAWGLTFFWWYPQPAGLLAAAAIAFTVQLSSPWLSSSKRQEIAERAVA